MSIESLYFPQSPIFHNRRYNQKQIHQMKFEDKLKATLKQIEGKEASLVGPSNCIRILLQNGTEYWCTVKEVGSDSFTIEVSYTGGGREKIVVRMKEVASFSNGK